MNATKRGALQILGLALALTVAYSFALQVTGIRAWFCETNYHANLLEVEDYLYGPPSPVVLVGSSLTMTLLPQYFAEVGVNVRNLAMAGGKPITGLRLLSRRTDRPTVVLIEMNTFLQQPGPIDGEILAAIDGFTFRLAKWFPPLRTSARPSSIVYTFLKIRKDAIRNPSATPAATVATSAGEVDAPADPPQPTLNSVDSELVDRIRQLQAAGVKVGIYRLPVGGRGEKTDLSPLTVARALGLPFLDLRDELDRRGTPITYTDNLHLRVQPARAAAQILADWVQSGMPSR